MRTRMVLMALAALTGVIQASASPRSVVRVRASEAVLPCLRKALAGTSEDVRVETGPARGAFEADVVVGPSGEIDRALESGTAFSDSDEGLGAIAWVLLGPGPEAATLRDLGRSGEEVAVLAGPEGSEARRVVGEVARVREASVRELLAARAAVVPQSLAPRAAGTRLDEIRPIRARAAVLRNAREPEAARRLVAWLASDAARRDFATCGTR